MNRILRHGSADHERAHELAALRLDERLQPADAVWLDGHLAVCADCAAAAADYDADRIAFRVLRDAPLEPPRDLWARTAATIDAESGARARGGARRPRTMRASALLAPLAGLAVVVIVVGTGLLNGTPAVPQPTGQAGVAPTPIAMTAGDVSVLSQDGQGGLQIQTRRVDEVCPPDAEACRVEPSFEVAQLAGIGESDSVDPFMSPTRDSLVLVKRGTSGSDGVFVVPVTSAQAATTPAATPATTPAATPSPESTAEPASPEPAPDPTAAPPTTEPASSAPTEAPSSPDVSPSGTPTDAPSDTSASPTAPIETPSVTPEPTPEPKPKPTPVVAVTPGPGGALEIARDVVVVGNLSAYSADGSRFAFTARPADGSAGPDVYVWSVGDTVARAMTTDHRSVFAGWGGRRLLVSRVVDGTPHTFVVNAKTGEVLAEHGRDAWLPTVAPAGDRAAWWDGSVRLADDGVTWIPEKGRLVVGTWPDADGGEQILARGSVPEWQVRWAPDGTALAVWTAGKNSSAAGRLSLYAVDPETGRVKVGSPMLEDAPAFESFSLEGDRLVWSAPGSDDRTVQVLAWDGDTVLGVLELSGEGGATVVR